MLSIFLSRKMKEVRSETVSLCQFQGKRLKVKEADRYKAEEEGNQCHSRYLGVNLNYNLLLFSVSVSRWLALTFILTEIDIFRLTNIVQSISMVHIFLETSCSWPSSGLSSGHLLGFFCLLYV